MVTIIAIDTPAEIIKTTDKAPNNVFRRHKSGEWECMTYDSWETIKNPWVLEKAYQAFKRMEAERGDDETLYEIYVRVNNEATRINTERLIRQIQQQEQKKEQPQPGQMTKEEAERILDALINMETASRVIDLCRTGG